ncbi:hypothetical protein [Bradyrhizobium sp.]|uniref:hypothetical protein n=1 Tax=Bradyrhizobium sp. TaxID=376 RepID=UPI0039E65E4E
MPLAPEDLKFAVDDARRRHAAVVDLIAASDRQSLGFLQLYVALAGGAFSGAAAILLPTVGTMPRPLGFGLLGFALPLTVGAVLCMIAVWPSNINLPGRTPNFWIWALRHEAEEVYLAYLDNLQVKEKQNSDLNRKQGRYMLAAKIAGVAAPIAGVLVGTAAILANW